MKCLGRLVVLFCWILDLLVLFPSSQAQCTQGAIRLQGGNTTSSGRVEICNNNTWGTVCDDSWDSTDARVACRQLGLPSEAAVALTSGFTSGTGPIFLDDVACSGFEPRLIDCVHGGIGSHDCVHTDDAGVNCTDGDTCTQGTIRLQGGSSVRGRVEICNNNVWGTVCDHLWGTADAHVACRHLGFSDNSGAVALTTGFTNGVGQIWLSDVRCRGTETRLTDCTHSGFGVHSCTHLEDAGVRCTTCTQGAIRLQGGNITNGRVEICNSNEWGTVCDDLWGTTDAQVVCRQLGFEVADAIALTSGFTNGAGQTWLSNVQCRGSETTLTACSHSGFGVNSCSSHNEDAGVACFPCTQGDIRLRGGTATFGRVEICNNNTWGTVCDDFWDNTDAIVACRQLGYEMSGSSSQTFGFSNGVGQIWLDSVRCRGNETRLIDCPANPLGVHDCFHFEDAGVRCTPCITGEIRLRGGTNTSGRVEICQSDEWGTVCDDFWDDTDAQVACRQLGFEDTSAVAVTSGFTNGAGQIWLSDVRCAGTETRLTSCTHAGFGVHTCSHDQDAGVRCPPCTQGAIRLRGGNTNTTGRVEICNNVWGTVCDDLWGTDDAQVACRQLGFEPIGAVAVTFGFTNGAGQIWLSNAQCLGNESRLIDCRANELGVHHCDHIEDAGVRCLTCTTGTVRLRGGNATSGRVEICNNAVWGTVCDDLWDSQDAQVVCTQLGYAETGAVALTTGFTNGTGQIWLSDVRCAGTETRLTSCTHAGFGVHTCSHDQDAGVRCTPCTQGAIRLRGGNTNTTGRVEICNNVWGTVCDDLWGTADAQVACRQLGFEPIGAVAVTFGFTNGAGQIWLSNAQCLGNESRLIDCRANELGVHHCSHTEDAGVRCLTCTTGTVRLRGGNATSGRVEICNNAVWGTVCDDLWDTQDAQVVCRQLGYEATGDVALTTGFTNGTGQIWLSDVRCAGTETSLTSCIHAGFGVHNCSHDQDAGVSCTPCSPQGAIRLRGGNTNTTGRVEICNNVWGTVCDDLWGTTDAQVACRQLGFETIGAVALTFGFTNGAGQIWLSNAQCLGTESRLIDCRANELGIHHCSHTEDAGVRCPTCTTGTVRLRGGNATSGRVEICNNAVWGTVCDDLWDSQDAQVVCRQLGYEATGAVALTTGFTNGAGQIWLNNVQCQGNELRLTDCTIPAFGTINCPHAEDAGIRCRTCTQGAIRLQGGNTTSGRVEICNNVIWGTVCDDSFTSLDAQVACLQLGFFAAGAQVLTLFAVPDGTGQIWLDDLGCRGTEIRLIDCPARLLGSHNCGHGDDVGVSCQQTGPTCTQGAIRLQGGTTMQGRVEICNNNIWGTVCDDLWGIPDAQVVCRQLGFQPTGASALNFGFTNGVGVIWLSDVQCLGTETRLIDCRASPLGSNTCNHFEDAGVRCSTAPDPCTQGSLRLQGGTTTSGRVEICNNNVWGTVCDDLWGTSDARVACRQLGFEEGVAVPLTSGFNNGVGQIWLTNVQCRGNESRLVDCTIPPLGTPSCTHIEDAGVRCTSCSPQGAIRLIPQGTAGRVEICNENRWGTVCHDLWSTSNARVACRQLGFSTTGVAELNGFAVADGTGPIWLDNVACHGTEARLVDCPANPLGSHDCVHAEDAGVRCLVTASTNCTQGAIRLQEGTAMSGRLEICNNNVWGTVCDDLWGSPDAQVACRQLGFLSVGAIALSSTDVPDGTGQIWLDDLSCRGTESRLIDCPAGPLGTNSCGHREDAGVVCALPTSCPQGAIRLVGGNVTRGRVEICHNNIWGTVCDDSWSDFDAKVACRQLGFSSDGAVALTTGFANGVGQIWLDNVQCRGSETRLIDCPANLLERHNCNHFDDAGVSCTIDCQQNSVPVLSTVVRSSPTTSHFNVSFSNINPAAVFRVSYYTNTEAGFNLDNLVGTFQANQSEVAIESLNPCLSYWVVVTSEILDCDDQLSTQPQVIGLFQPSRFKFALSVEDAAPCREWIAEDIVEKVSDMDNSLNSALVATCGISAPCTANSQFTCDGSEINYETLLVSSESISSQLQLNCLNIWLSSTEEIDINGVPAMIRAIAPETEASSSIPAYVWPIVIFAIAGALTSIILAVFIYLKMYRKKQSEKFTSAANNVGMITNKDAGNTLSEQASGDYDHPPLDEETEFSESEADDTAV